MPIVALVDDDRNILTSVSISLEAEGYRVMTYSDGASAFEGFKTSPPDLALLDIKMPRMDGTAAKVRRASDQADQHGAELAVQRRLGMSDFIMDARRMLSHREIERLKLKSGEVRAWSEAYPGALQPAVTPSR